MPRTTTATRSSFAAMFKVAAKDEATFQKVIADIKKRLHFESNPKALTRFNGIDYE